MKQFLTGISFCAALLATGGCTDGSELSPDSGDGKETGASVSLTIHATATNYANLPQAGASSGLSTRATESGNITTFAAGDQIGIYAVKNGMITDNLENIPLTCEVATDGTSKWVAPDGVTFYYDANVSYFAYYPYREDFDTEMDDPDMSDLDEFAGRVAELDIFAPPTDTQSAPAVYAAHDLMMAIGTATADSSDPKKKVLRLNFKHQFALLVLEPQAYMTCTAPADGGFVYRAGSVAPVTDPNVANATINSVSACRMSDGTYRVLVKPTASASQIAGSYLTSTDNKTVSFSGSSIGTGFASGHCYKVEVIRSTHNTASSGVRALAPGDFVFHGAGGIEIYPGNGALTDGKIPGYSDVVGIVVTCDKNRLTDAACNAKGWTHAYVMGLGIASAETFQWSNYYEDTAIPNTLTMGDAELNMNGYAETEALLEQQKDNLSQYPAFSFLKDYRAGAGSFPADVARSPWFIPSPGQWFDVMANIGGKSPRTFNNYDSENTACQYDGDVIWNAIETHLQKVNTSWGSYIMCLASSEGFEVGSAFWFAILAKSISRIGIGTKTAGPMSVYPFFAF